MSREEFLRQLEALLSGISEEERADAMAFYRSYFEDAGEGNEAAIIEELESPQKVAESILKDLGAEGNTKDSPIEEHRQEDPAASTADADAGGYQQSAGGYQQSTGGYQQGAGGYQYSANGQTYQGTYVDDEGQAQKNKNNAIIVTVIAAIVLSPVWLTLVVVIAAVMLGAVCALFGIAVAVVAVMAVLIVTGFVVTGLGIGWFFSGSFAVGLALAGGGLIILALGLLTVVLAVWVFGALIPWACKGIAGACKSVVEKRKERKEA